jgi:ATP-dependent protease ClpP protease subunit
MNRKHQIVTNKVIQKTERKFVKPTNFTTFIDDDIDIDNRVIHLFKPIDFESVSNVAKGIQLMMAKGTDRPIDIYIGSFGGCPYAAFWLYDFIKVQVNLEINTYACGAAMSGGSIIFMAGDHRYMYEHSRLMLHSIASIAEGKLFVSMVPEIEECREIYKDMCKLYALHSNQDFKTWYRWLKFEDKTINSTKALELGLVDKVIKP